MATNKMNIKTRVYLVTAYVHLAGERQQVRHTITAATGSGALLRLRGVYPGAAHVAVTPVCMIPASACNGASALPH